MASDSETNTPDQPSTFLEQLINSRNRDLSFFLPFVLGVSGTSRQGETNPDRERIILINPLTQGMIVIEGASNLESLLQNASQKQGIPPASKSSIESMPRIAITGDDLVEECSICLDGWEIGGEAREMPCKHRFHSNCIEKWLGIHGSCPVCRFEMPADEGEPKKRPSSEIWVSFSFSGSGRRDSGSDDGGEGTVNSGEEGS
ncbi:hypothetical protein Sjap_015660 [Stephania japonica]|uniref:RING-type E3 ubiquitin transferase n=1 Tax=Stephania japonica TaxID=461633 RepID=A0AAP0IJQ1_9MAGN